MNIFLYLNFKDNFFFRRLYEVVRMCKILEINNVNESKNFKLVFENSYKIIFLNIVFI